MSQASGGLSTPSMEEQPTQRKGKGDVTPAESSRRAPGRAISKRTVFDAETEQNFKKIFGKFDRMSGRLEIVEALATRLEKELFAYRSDDEEEEVDSNAGAESPYLLYKRQKVDRMVAVITQRTASQLDPLQIDGQNLREFVVKEVVEHSDKVAQMHVKIRELESIVL